MKVFPTCMIVLSVALWGLVGYIAWTSTEMPRWLAICLPLSLSITFTLAFIIASIRTKK